MCKLAEVDFEGKCRSKVCYFDEKEFVKTYYLMRKERRYVVFNFDRLL